ncbi:glycosyltransferase family 4 protein [Flavobacterium sp.]|uniref:glycosyltransferase family 4 protein n=1 Tax=Flavobacterium sp. TaxID=239 RepID=UPI00391A60E1
MTKPKLIRLTTVPISLEKLLTGQLHFMSSFYEVVAVSSDKSRLEKIGAQENVRTFHLEMSRKITPINDFIAVIKLFLFLRKENPTIVHTHTPKAGIVGMLAAALAGVPNRYHTVAGMPLLEATGFKRKVLNFVEKMTYACATKIYPNSRGLTDIILANNFCKAEKLKVLANGSSNGIDTSYFNPELYSDTQKATLRKQLTMAQDDFVFVFVGRLVADKGINELVVAFEQLSAEHPKIKLLLVGDYEADLDPLSAETLSVIKNNQAIISVGFQNDVRPYLAISDALAFPSYREGFPNVVMQAGAMGLPAIVSDINGCNEIIKEGENGLIIPVKNSNALLKAMKKITEQNEVTHILREKARAMIVNRYEQRLVWQAILAEYKS